MLSESDLRELLSFEAHTPMLSVYLNTNPAEGNADAYKLRLRSMLKDVDLPEDVDAILRYFDREYDWSGRSVAAFSCVSRAFFRIYPLAVPVQGRVRINDHPHVKPLVDLIDSYGGYGVILVDQQGARLFSFHLGELREQEGILGETIRHTKRGGGSQATGRRGGVAGQTDYVDEVADRNFKEAVEFATRFFSENNIRRILIGGTEANVAAFRSLLPKAWQSLVVGTFPMSMTASHTEVLQRAFAVGDAAEQRREIQLVENLVTNAAKGKGAVLNLEDTLHAIRDGRVQTLVIRAGFRSPGFRCKGCGYLTTKESAVCPFCGNSFATLPDAVELAVHQVMQSGGDVEVLHDGQTIEGFDRIGAVLRY